MPAPIELKFSGDILGIIDFPAVGLMKKCMIPFNCLAVNRNILHLFGTHGTIAKVTDMSTNPKGVPYLGLS